MADLQLAISEKVTQRLFNKLRDNFALSHSDSGNFGPFTVSYSAGIKLKNGTVDFQPDGTVLIKELDIVYDPLKLTFGIDIPPVPIGGFCIIPTPWGCALRAPTKTFFAGNPDIAVTLDLSGIITTEVSASCSAKLKHFDDPAGAGMTRWAALAANRSNKWELYLDPGYVDIDFIDIVDTVGNLVDKLVDAAVDALLGFLPSWARNFVKKVLGNLTDLIRDILDIPDDVGEWLSNLLGVGLDLFSFATQMVGEYLGEKYPVHRFDDPYPFLRATTGPNGAALVPVLVPVLTPAVLVNNDELVVSGSLGVL